MDFSPPISGSSAAGPTSFGISPSGETLGQKIKNVEDCFTQSIEPNFRNALNNGAPIAAVMVALSAIDFLASYYAGKECQTDEYKDMVVNYLDILVTSKQKKYGTTILFRNLRCALFHNYTTAKTPLNQHQAYDVVYVLTDKPEKYGEHLILIKGSTNKVLFHIQAFFDHVIQAKNRYFVDLRSSSNLQKNFEQWYDEAGYLAEYIF